jgi:hypothetical protein
MHAIYKSANSSYSEWRELEYASSITAIVVAVTLPSVIDEIHIPPSKFGLTRMKAYCYA